MNRVYLDTMVWIYALESDLKFGAQAQAMLKAVRKDSFTLLSSHFLLAELLVYPERDGNAFLSASYRRALRAGEVKLVSFNVSTAITFARIRAQFKVSSPDAIHLALAASAGADFFVTEDTRLQRITVPGIGQIVDLSYSLR